MSTSRGRLTIDEIKPENEFHTIEQYSRTTCFSCNRKPAKLFSCGRCARVAYCNAVCQKSDFKVHLPFCKAWTSLLAALPSQPPITTFPPTRSELEQVMSFVQLNIMLPLHRILAEGGYPVGTVSTYLVLNDVRCVVCYAPLRGRDWDGCEVCVLRWCNNERCSQGRKSTHKTSGVCSMLSAIARDEAFRRNYEQSHEREGIVSIWSPPRIIRFPTPLPPSWTAYLDDVRPPNLAKPRDERVMAQHSLSIPLTIVASLFKFGLDAKFSNPRSRRDLRVDLVGAEVAYEMASCGMAFEEITHLLPGVRRLLIVMVGPKVGVQELPDPRPVQTCPECVSQERTRHRWWWF